MTFRADAALERAASVARCALLATVICSYAISVAAQSEPSPASVPVARVFPKRLAVNVVADERSFSTFQQRVGSWFSDGTEVSVTLTSELDEQRLLASSATEVKAWIIPLSAERALLTLSSVAPPGPPRYLVREIRLRQGFDEVGLERLASVMYSAFVALREGTEGVPREQAEHALGEAGVTAGFQPAPSEPAPPLAPASPRVAFPPPKSNASSLEPPARPLALPFAALLVEAGYGLRFRGAEGVAHGPRLALGLQLQNTLAAFDLQLSGQYSFPSAFHASPFSATVQSTALRGELGIERRLGASILGQALLGFGADLARISARAESDAGSTNTQALARESGTQWRAAGELTLVLLLKGARVDVGIYAQTVFAFEDVHYNASTSEGEVLLVRPWRVQPAFGIRGRFRSGL